MLFMAPTTATPLVELRNLTFGYGERVILDNISLTLPRGRPRMRYAPSMPVIQIEPRAGSTASGAGSPAMPTVIWPVASGAMLVKCA